MSRPTVTEYVHDVGLNGGGGGGSAWIPLDPPLNLNKLMVLSDRRFSDFGQFDLSMPRTWLTTGSGPMLRQRWASTSDSGPILSHRCVTFSIHYILL